MPALGEYPCCGGALFLSWDEESFGYAPEDCPHCGAKVWHRFSNYQPESWTEEEFLKRHSVNHETRSIKER